MENTQDYVQIWNKTLKYLRESKGLPDYFLDIIVNKSQPVAFKNNELIIKVPTFIERDFWNMKVNEPFAMAALMTCDIELIPVPKTEEDIAQDALPIIKETPFYEMETQQPLPLRKIDSNLNPEYTFKNFVIGESNRIANAASQTVSQVPGTVYNPLFIYGGVGLGKTHLMQAIGHAFLENQPDARIKYVTAENFMNDFVSAIRRNEMEQFRAEYRTLDMLLVDDIQFMNKKGETQQEFFQVFEALTTNQKQIVITCDRLPKELDQLEERLVSRFDRGLSIEINTAEYETRLAILQKKVETRKLSIPIEVLELIAAQFTNNIRELEGALLRVQAFSGMEGKDISLELAANALTSLKPATTIKAETNVRLIQSEVAAYYNITVADLKSKRRIKAISVPRQIAMYLCREMTKSSLPAIGADFGGKDHTSVMYAHKQTAKKVQTDTVLQKEIQEIKSRLS